MNVWFRDVHVRVREAGNRLLSRATQILSAGDILNRSGRQQPNPSVLSNHNYL